MLRMALLGLLILLGVGVLSAMEFRTPPRSAVTIVQPLAEPNAGISDSHDALAKADRLEVAAVSNETPAQAVLITKALLCRKTSISVLRSFRGRSSVIGTIPNRRRSLPLHIPSRGQSQPLPSELPFHSVQRPAAILSPVGSRRLVACVRR